MGKHSKLSGLRQRFIEQEMNLDEEARRMVELPIQRITEARLAFHRGGISQDMLESIHKEICGSEISTYHMSH